MIDHTRIISSGHRLRCNTVTSVIRAVKIVKLMRADFLSLRQKITLLLLKFNLPESHKFILVLAPCVNCADKRIFLSILQLYALMQI